MCLENIENKITLDYNYLIIESSSIEVEFKAKYGSIEGKTLLLRIPFPVFTNQRFEKITKNEQDEIVNKFISIKKLEDRFLYSDDDTVPDVNSKCSAIEIGLGELKLCLFVILKNRTIFTAEFSLLPNEDVNQFLNSNFKMLSVKYRKIDPKKGIRITSYTYR